MAVDIVVSGKNTTQFNGPTQMPLWDGLPGMRAGQFAWDMDGLVDPIAGPGEIVWNGSSWERNTTSASIPGLDQVTAVENITPTSMFVETTGITDGTPSTEANIAQVSVSNNLAASTVKIIASDIDNGVGADQYAQILMQGAFIEVIVSAGVDLVFKADDNQTLLIMLSNGRGIQFANGIQDLTGTGVPEGVVTAIAGSTYRQLGGSPGSTFWSKQSGSGNTGWAPLG